jgi:hypothetical protein
VLLTLGQTSGIHHIERNLPHEEEEVESDVTDFFKTPPTFSIDLMFACPTHDFFINLPFDGIHRVILP